MPKLPTLGFTKERTMNSLKVASAASGNWRILQERPAAAFSELEKHNRRFHIESSLSPNVEGQPRRLLARRVPASVLDSMVSIRVFIL
jgi:hypothetical protein